MSEDLTPREGWEEDGSEEGCDDPEGWLEHHLGEEALEELRRIQIRYEFYSLDHIIFVALSLLISIEKREEEGKRLGIFKFRDPEDPQLQEGKHRVEATITTLERLIEEVENARSAG